VKTRAENHSTPLPFLKDGIAQVGLVVPELERAVEAWWKLFGVGPWHFYTYGKPLVRRMSYRGRRVEYRMRIALSWIGPLRIELIEPLGGPTVYAEFVKEHGHGVHHFGVLVQEMEEAIRRAEEAGLAMTMDGAGFGLKGDGHYAYLETERLLGTTIELIQRPEGRIAPEKIYPPPPEG
jgi:methylmalonyl-CoA/ethylmalonyl-CoA epimerase